MKIHAINGIRSGLRCAAASYYRHPPLPDLGELTLQPGQSDEKFGGRRYVKRKMGDRRLTSPRLGFTPTLARLQHRPDSLYGVSHQTALENRENQPVCIFFMLDSLFRGGRGFGQEIIGRYARNHRKHPRAKC